MRDTRNALTTVSMSACWSVSVLGVILFLSLSWGDVLCILLTRTQSQQYFPLCSKSMDFVPNQNNGCKLLDYNNLRYFLRT